MNQMKGKCGDYQMKSQPAFGATANMGNSPDDSRELLHKRRAARETAACLHY